MLWEDDIKANIIITADYKQCTKTWLWICGLCVRISTTRSNGASMAAAFNTEIHPDYGPTDSETFISVDSIKPTWHSVDSGQVLQIDLQVVSSAPSVGPRGGVMAYVNWLVRPLDWMPWSCKRNFSVWPVTVMCADMCRLVWNEVFEQPRWADTPHLLTRHEHRICQTNTSYIHWRTGERFKGISNK